MTNDTGARPGSRVERAAHVGWVPLDLMRLNPLAQRDLRPARVNHLLARPFDTEKMGYPTVNERDGFFYIMDGQHRVEALKVWLKDWEGQEIECLVYVGLTEKQEAEMFLALNDRLNVQSFANFRIGILAGMPDPVEVDRVVREQGLCVSQDKSDGSISAVGTLMRVYQRTDGETLGRTLRIIRDAYGTPGLEAAVIDGIGLLCNRYGGELDEEYAIARLSAAHGGVNGLLGKAGSLRQMTGRARSHCVAAAAVEIINGARGGKKLPQWWRGEA